MIALQTPFDTLWLFSWNIHYSIIFFV